MNFYSRYFWNSALVLIGLIMMAPGALAEERQVSYILDSSQSRTFRALLQEAESIAKESIAQEFTQSSDVTEVSITISGDRNGQIVPLLIAVVSRQEWQQGNSLAQATRFSSSEFLLGFLEPASNPSGAGGSSVAAVPLPAPPPFEDFLSLENDPGFRDD
ncbi:MAG: hypothetical protein F6K19_01215 [Cyanothece sp. SIO1E1]|nr:hypothetical protein [Cyanothece sp. SIO1E1]